MTYTQTQKAKNLNFVCMWPIECECQINIVYSQCRLNIKSVWLIRFWLLCKATHARDREKYIFFLLQTKYFVLEYSVESNCNYWQWKICYLRESNIFRDSIGLTFFVSYTMAIWSEMQCQNRPHSWFRQCLFAEHSHTGNMCVFIAGGKNLTRVYISELPSNCEQKAHFLLVNGNVHLQCQTFFVLNIDT